MAAILIVASAEERGILVEQCRLQGREIFRNAVDLLIEIGREQLVNGAKRELLLILEPWHPPEGAGLDTAPRIFCQRMLKPQ